MKTEVITGFRPLTGIIFFYKGLTQDALAERLSVSVSVPLRGLYFFMHEGVSQEGEAYKVSVPLRGLYFFIQY